LIAPGAGPFGYPPAGGGLAPAGNPVEPLLAVAGRGPGGPGGRAAGGPCDCEPRGLGLGGALFGKGGLKGGIFFTELRGGCGGGCLSNIFRALLTRPELLSPATSTGSIIIVYLTLKGAYLYTKIKGQITGGGLYHAFVDKCIVQEE
jgi:hypothetical protein